MRRRALILAGAVVLVVAVMAGFGLVHGYGPRAVTVPAAPDHDRPGCANQPDGWDRSPWPALFRVGVDTGARSVTAQWWPTMNDGNCQVLVTHGDTTMAAALVRDVRQAPAIGPGVYHCPMDVGGAVDLFFGYGQGRWERVRVYPTGCGRITAPARTPRRAVFGDDLAALAPPGPWRQVLR